MAANKTISVFSSCIAFAVTLSGCIHYFSHSRLLSCSVCLSVTCLLTGIVMKWRYSNLKGSERLYCSTKASFVLPEENEHAHPHRNSKLSAVKDGQEIMKWRSSDFKKFIAKFYEKGRWVRNLFIKGVENEVNGYWKERRMV